MRQQFPCSDKTQAFAYISACTHFPRSANACMGPLFRFIGQAIGVALLYVYTGFTKPCHMQ